MEQINFESFRGERDDNGFITGYDYRAQMWVATNPSTPRDASATPGSACNPLAHLRDLPVPRA
ncbi:MAG: hypothetical protein DDT20_00851 [Firmicutes bacterium]|nr:hypothetical protein [Bacillota bacterium]